MARAAEGRVREAVVLPPGFRVRMGGAAAPRLQGFQLASADAGPMSQTDAWERLAGRVRSAPSVVTEFERLLAERGRVTPRNWDRYEVDVYNAKIAALTGLHRAELARQEWFRKVAIGVTQGDLASCQTALDHLGPFKVLRGFGSSLNVVITRSWCVEAWLIGNTNGVIPTEEEGWSPTGKRSSKKLPNARYWEIYQDHVCSAALSIAREIFAILPLPYALVHAGFPFDNPRTGHPDCAPMLSVAVERQTFLGLNLQRVDPSDAMANFAHRMQLKKTSGLAPVDALTPADLGVAED